MTELFDIWVDKNMSSFARPSEFETTTTLQYLISIEYNIHQINWNTTQFRFVGKIKIEWYIL